MCRRRRCRACNSRRLLRSQEMSRPWSSSPGTSVPKCSSSQRAVSIVRSRSTPVSMPIAVEHVEQVFGRYVTRRRRRERAAADAADARIERIDARFDRRVRIRDAGIARVVEVTAERHAGQRCRAAVASRSVTCAGTPAPIESAIAISTGSPAASSTASATTRAGCDFALERAAERGRDRDLRAQPQQPSRRAPSRARPTTDSAVVAPWLRRLKVSVATTTMPISSQPAASARSNPRRFSTRPM